MDVIADLKELDKYLHKIDKIFTVDHLKSKNIKTDDIVSYYRESNKGYQYLHSSKGAVHMSLNYDGVFSPKGFYAQLDEIAEQIKKLQPKRVLELGCGKGFNSKYLCQKFPDIEFYGIDITDKHLSIANKNASKFKHLKFAYGDFHQLDFADETFDLVFELESICHTDDCNRVLSEINRVLNPGGSFISYEGFRESGFDQLNESLITAAKLTEKSMAVNQFEIIDVWLKIAERRGFEIVLKENITSAILPNIKRLQTLARGYYKYPLLSRFFLQLLPSGLIMNSVVGLLMPFTLHNKAHGYYKLLLRKSTPLS